MSSTLTDEPAGSFDGLVRVPITRDAGFGPDLWAPHDRAHRATRSLHRLLTRSPLTWLRSQALLLGVLSMQAALSLRLRNSLFADEALYLYAGHREIELFLHGSPTFDNYASYFSGAPFLYPVLGAAADSAAGPTAARAVSLLLMLTTTVLLYWMTRRLFDQHTAVLAAIVFAVAEPTQFMGHLATYDAPALCLLAVAACLVVRSASRSTAGVLLAAPCLVLAAATKYAALLFIPTVIALAVLASVAARGWRRALATGALLAGTTAVLAGAVLAVIPQLQAGIESTTSARAAGTDQPSVLLTQSTAYIGAAVLLAAAGTVLHWRTSQAPGRHDSPLVRLLLGVTLTATALLAPADQVHLHTLTSLQKHVGYGLLFAAPMAGVALAGLLGRHIADARRLTLVLTVCVLLTWAGISQAGRRFHDWPDSTGLVAALTTQVRPVTGRYLIEEPEVPRYYLRTVVRPYQWAGTYYFAYTTHSGAHLVGAQAYTAAIADHYFDVVALRYGPTAPLDVQIDSGLRAARGYQLIGKIPADSSYGGGFWWIWRIST